MNKPYLQMLNTLAVASRPSAPPAPAVPDYFFIELTGYHSGDCEAKLYMYNNTENWHLQVFRSADGITAPDGTDTGWEDWADATEAERELWITDGTYHGESSGKQPCLRVYFRATPGYSNTVISSIFDAGSSYGLGTDNPGGLALSIGGDLATLCHPNPAALTEDESAAYSVRLLFGDGENGRDITNSSHAPLIHSLKKLGNGALYYAFTNMSITSVEIMATSALRKGVDSGVTVAPLKGTFIGCQYIQVDEYGVIKMHLPSRLSGIFETTYDDTGYGVSSFGNFYCPASFCDAQDETDKVNAYRDQYIPGIEMTPDYWMGWNVVNYPEV